VCRDSPAALGDVIDRAIRKDKQARYESVRALPQATLDAYELQGEPGRATPAQRHRRRSVA
jgi:hypothetical protein